LRHRGRRVVRASHRAQREGPREKTGSGGGLGIGVSPERRGPVAAPGGAPVTGLPGTAIVAAPCVFPVRGRREEPQIKEGGAAGTRGATRAMLPCETGKGGSLVAFHHRSRSPLLPPSPGIPLSPFPKSRLPHVRAQAPHCLLALVPALCCTDGDPWRGPGRARAYRHVPAVAPPGALAFKKNSHACSSLSARDGACRATATGAVTPAPKSVRPALQSQIIHTDSIAIKACHLIRKVRFSL